MKLSTKGRYGLRAMVDLAVHSKNNNVPISSISERQSISENYLEQIIAKLKKSGLVKSTRGSQGGYSLAKPMAEITVGDILRSLEGDLTPVNCSLLKEELQCEEEDNCVTKFVWKKISDSINTVVDEITLKDLIEENLKINGENINNIMNPRC
ncbi:RrF2 family transcriptional regulator [Natranaerovirga hydrolytica]|nr:Rrf2 family transcriptional regulator [Natranaerovirga hydrolytica]